jgi:hypothetical protein
MEVISQRQGSAPSGRGGGGGKEYLTPTEAEAGSASESVETLWSKERTLSFCRKSLRSTILPSSSTYHSHHTDKATADPILIQSKANKCIIIM